LTKTHLDSSSKRVGTAVEQNIKRKRGATALPSTSQGLSAPGTSRATVDPVEPQNKNERGM